MRKSMKRNDRNSSDLNIYNFVKSVFQIFNLSQAIIRIFEFIAPDYNFSQISFFSLGEYAFRINEIQSD